MPACYECSFSDESGRSSQDGYEGGSGGLVLLTYRWVLVLLKSGPTLSGISQLEEPARVCGTYKKSPPPSGFVAAT